MSMNRRSFLGALGLGGASASLRRAFAGQQTAGADISVLVHPEKSVAIVPENYGGLSYEAGQLAHPDFFAPSNKACCASAGTAVSSRSGLPILSRQPEVPRPTLGPAKQPYGASPLRVRRVRRACSLQEPKSRRTENGIKSGPSISPWNRDDAPSICPQQARRWHFLANSNALGRR